MGIPDAESRRGPLNSTPDRQVGMVSGIVITADTSPRNEDTDAFTGRRARDQYLYLCIDHRLGKDRLRIQRKMCPSF